MAYSTTTLHEEHVNPYQLFEHGSEIPQFELSAQFEPSVKLYMSINADTAAKRQN